MDAEQMKLFLLSQVLPTPTNLLDKQLRFCSVLLMSNFAKDAMGFPCILQGFSWIFILVKQCNIEASLCDTNNIPGLPSNR